METNDEDEAREAARKRLASSIERLDEVCEEVEKFNAQVRASQAAAGEAAPESSGVQEIRII